MGPIVLIATLLVYPRLNDKFSPLALWRSSAIVFAIVYMLFSILPVIAASSAGLGEWGQMGVLLFLMGFRFAMNVVAYTSMGVLVSSEARTTYAIKSQNQQLNQIALPEKRGVLMGSVLFRNQFLVQWIGSLELPFRSAQTAMSLGRAIGPAIGGTVWSWSVANGLPSPFDYHFIVSPCDLRLLRLQQ